MTRSLSSMILSLIEDLYLFSMMLWVVLLSPSFTTPPGPTPPAVTWHWSMLGLAVLWQEPGCICLIGSLSPPPIITGTVVRMLLLISVWRTKTYTKTVFSLNHNLCLHVNSSAYRDLQSCVLDGCGQGGDACRTLHGRQHLCPIWFESCENQWVRLKNLRLLDQNLSEDNHKLNVFMFAWLSLWN